MERTVIAMRDGGTGAGAQHGGAGREASLILSPPGGRARENRKFIQAPSPEIWSETISGGEEVLAGKIRWPVLGYLLGKNFRRRDRDRLVPPRRMDAAVCRAEVCYAFGRSTGGIGQ
jgi:hypothetical protein